MTDHFDLIVIGAGSAARDAAGKAAREFGASVALIERTRWGGSCPNVACRPTKAYLVAAELAYTVNELSDWMGVRCGPAAVDLARVRAWKDSLRRTQESWQEVLAKAGYELVPGEASFVDARTVRVGDRELTAERILIASGSRTAVPRVPGIDAIEWIDHISALELEQIPESLLIVGAGPVGLEFAQIFARFGSRVTIVNHGPTSWSSRTPGSRATAATSSLTSNSARTSAASGPRATSRPARSSRRPPSTRPASRSRTCSARRARGTRTTRPCRPRSSPTPSSARSG